ncbi:MAG TPA: sigma-70 family RNA polymerase sigma factor [Polyangiaceae bacterium]|nr:sigma-70 family RNA polymerase sigma factor [Polyangiaceae bacterium]
MLRRLQLVGKPADQPEEVHPQRAQDPLRALARRACEGEADAIRELVMELGGPILRTVRKVLGGGHPDAEDVAQEAILGLLSSLQSFRGDCTVLHFAHQVALRRALHARRHFKTREKVGDQVLDAEGHAAAGEAPLEAAISRERRRIVRSLLDELPEATAEALALHFMLGYTVEEIAAMLDVSPNTVWSRLKLGKRSLKRELDSNGQLIELLGGRRS